MIADENKNTAVAPQEAPATPMVPAQAAQPTIAPFESGLAEEGEAEPAAPLKTPNFQEKYAYASGPIEDFSLLNETAFLPSATQSATREAMAKLPEGYKASTSAEQAWIGNINTGLEATPFSQGLEGTIGRDDADFQQAIEGPTGLLAGFAPNLKRPNGVPSGDTAMFHIRKAVGLGTVFSVPLWHSGFWITLKAPSDSALLELYRQITSEKASLGRNTYGFLFSNNTSYSSRLILDFAMDHLYESSFVPGKDEGSLRNYIRVPDLSLIIWGLACAFWPNGFQYERACVADPEKCHHVVHERINLSRLIWTDKSAVTDKQVKHMSKRSRGVHSLKEVKEYVDEFVLGQPKLIKINEDLSVTLKVPSASEHFESGYRWINDIEETYTRALTHDEGERDNYLINHGRATAMRSYGHFVEALHFENGEVTYTDVEQIEKALTTLTEVDDVRETFIDKTREYLDASVISLIAVPSYKCPACGGEQTSELHHRHRELIPLDPQQTFFQLLVQRLRKIEGR